MITFAMPMPLKVSGNAATDATSRMIYEKKIYLHVKRKLKLEENCTKCILLVQKAVHRGHEGKTKDSNQLREYGSIRRLVSSDKYAGGYNFQFLGQKKPGTCASR